MELTYRIDCRELTSRTAAHDCFARVFALPAFYGRNLVAVRRADGTAAVYAHIGAYRLPV